MEYRKAEDRSCPGGIVHNPASPYAREMARWEMSYSPYGPPGRPREREGNPQFPAMFYKMTRSATNGDFHVEHYQTAADEAEARNLASRGYVCGRAQAEAAIVEQEQAVAVASAERMFHEQRMSDKARAEAQLADDATGSHLAEVPVTPIRKRGRPVKTSKADLVSQS